MTVDQLHGTLVAYEMRIEDEDIAAYVLQDYQLVNTIIGLGEEVEEAIVF